LVPNIGGTYFMRYYKVACNYILFGAEELISGGLRENGH
jgi:hypothetical protein